jgi:hypothetical protein
VRSFGRVWSGVTNAPGGFVIYGSTGQPILPSGNPPGAQYPAGRGKGRWVEISTDAAGNNDLVWLTTLCQAILLNLNESPVYADVGLPARQSVLSGIAPDYNMSLLQKRFAPYFLSLVITRQPQASGQNPHYLVNLVTHKGVKLSARIPIPT